MRIAIVAPEFPPEIGGMERYSWEVAQGLSALGFPVTVLTKQGQPLTALPPVRFSVEPCLVGRERQDRVAVKARRLDFDIWHVMNAAWAWVAEYVAPVVVSIHGNDFMAPNRVVRPGLRERLNLPWGSRLDLYLGKWMTAYSMRKSLRRCRHVFANSRATEMLFLRKYPFCRGKTTVAFLGVSESFMQAGAGPAKSPGPPRFITVCRLSEPRKNVDIVLRALARLKETYEFQYVIVGEGILRSKLENLAQSLGLSERVFFAGPCSDRELVDHLRASDLFILTSSATKENVEGFGIVYLEANACGVPVLATRLGGAAEAVLPGKSGMFVDEITPESVAEALTSFLDGKSRFVASECRAFANRFSWPSIVEGMLHRYEAVLAPSIPT